MNIIQSNVKTMNLKEITDLLNVRHDKAMLKVDRMAKEPEFGTVSKMDIVYNAQGQTVETYILDKRQSVAVSSVLNTALLMRVIDRWEELESQQAPKPMTQLEMIAGMASSMVEVERKQVEQAKALEDITSKVERLETSDKVLSSCPVNAEGITSICARMNLKYSIPVWAVKEIVRGSYGIRPAGNVQNQHENANGSTYVVWWVSDITALFKRIAGESERVTATLVTHPTVSKRFKLI
jgi:hypothetical protein